MAFLMRTGLVQTYFGHDFYGFNTIIHGVVVVFSMLYECRTPSVLVQSLVTILTGFSIILRKRGTEEDTEQTGVDPQDDTIRPTGVSKTDHDIGTTGEEDQTTPLQPEPEI